MPSRDPHRGHPWEFSRSQDFVANKMKANDRRCRSDRTISKMAADRISHHLAQLLQGITLRGDRVTERSSDVTAIRFIVPNFEDDLAHWKKLLLRYAMGKHAPITENGRDFEDHR